MTGGSGSAAPLPPEQATSGADTSEGDGASFPPIVGSMFGVPIVNLSPRAPGGVARYNAGRNKLRHKEEADRPKVPPRKGFRTGVALASGTLIGSLGKDVLSIVWSGAPKLVTAGALALATAVAGVQLWWDKRKERHDDH